MLDWLDRQRKKTKTERARTAFFIAFITTMIVFVFWIFTLPAKFQTFGGVNLDREDREGGSFEEFGRTLDEGRNTVEEAIEAGRRPATTSTTTTP